MEDFKKLKAGVSLVDCKEISRNADCSSRTCTISVYIQPENSKCNPHLSVKPICGRKRRHNKAEAELPRASARGLKLPSIEASPARDTAIMSAPAGCTDSLTRWRRRVIQNVRGSVAQKKRQARFGSTQKVPGGRSRWAKTCNRGEGTACAQGNLLRLQTFSGKRVRSSKAYCRFTIAGACPGCKRQQRTRPLAGQTATHCPPAVQKPPAPAAPSPCGACPAA